MKLPFVLLVSGWVQALPTVAYAASRSRTRGAAYLAMGSLVSLFSNLIGRILVDTERNNQLLSYIRSPVTTIFFIFALALWQVTAREHRLLRAGLIGFLTTWVILVATVEDMRNFDLVTGPLYSLTILIAAAWTLLRRANVAEQIPLVQGDWFWACVGLAILGAGTALSSPVGAILLARDRFDLFNLVWHTRAVIVILAFLVMSWGIYRGPVRSKFATELDRA